MEKLKAFANACYLLFVFSLGVTLPFVIIDNRAENLLFIPCGFGVIEIILAAIYLLLKKN